MYRLAMMLYSGFGIRLRGFSTLYARTCFQFVTIAILASCFCSRAIGQDAGSDIVALPGSDGASAVDIQTARLWRDWLGQQSIPVSRCGSDLSQGTLVLDRMTPEQRAMLEDAGFGFLQHLEETPLQTSLRTASQYYDPSEIEALLAQVEIDFPAIARRFLVGTTSEGRGIYGLEISNNPGVDEDEPAIQFNAQHHAREVATSHVVMDVVEALTNGYGSDAQITSWVDNYKTICVPMVNPDGVQYVFDVNGLWRRNRMVHPGCTGVDLNRNYPYLWGPGCGSSGSCNDLYRGPSANSELETQSMIALAQQYHFVMATSYHAFGRFIDYPYACADGSPATLMPEHGVIDEMMRGVAGGIFSVDGVQYSVFSPVPLGGVNGDDTSWYYAGLGTYSFIVEVGSNSDGFEPMFSQVSGIVARNRGGWQYMYDRLGQARMDVHVTDGCSGEPMEAEVTLADFAFDTGESPRRTFLPYGRWTFMTEANMSYTLRISEPGFVTKDVAVNIGNEPVSVDVILERTSPPPEGCATSALVPTMSNWAMIVMFLLTAVSGSILLRRCNDWPIRH